MRVPSNVGVGAEVSRSIGDELRLSFSIELLVAIEEVEPPVQRPLSSTGLCRLAEGWGWKKERRDARERDREGVREAG